MATVSGGRTIGPVLEVRLVKIHEEEDLVVHNVPREWVLLDNFNNVNDE